MLPSAGKTTTAASAQENTGPVLSAGCKAQKTCKWCKVWSDVGAVSTDTSCEEINHRILVSFFVTTFEHKQKDSLNSSTSPQSQLGHRNTSTRRQPDPGIVSIETSFLLDNNCMSLLQAKTQKVQQEKAASKILAGTQNIQGLEEKLQVSLIIKRSASIRNGPNLTVNLHVVFQSYEIEFKC